MKKIILTALLLVTPVLANAATCTRADLTGSWKIYVRSKGVPGRCTLVMPAAGTAIAATSSCSFVGTPAAVPFTGTLAIGTDCHVTGKLNVNAFVRSIDAYISKDKANISGMGWDATTFSGEPFSGVKQ